MIWKMWRIKGFKWSDREISILTWGFWLTNWTWNCVYFFFSPPFLALSFVEAKWKYLNNLSFLPTVVFQLSMELSLFQQSHPNWPHFSLKSLYCDARRASFRKTPDSTFYNFHQIWAFSRLPSEISRASSWQIASSLSIRLYLYCQGT